MAAIKKSGYALKFASERLKDDKDIFLAAIKKYGYALKFASEKL